jgi:hypothetical protein
MENCTDQGGFGPWGQNPLIMDQMDLAFGSHTCLEISDPSPTQTDLVSYDIIVVEGGDYFWNTTRDWLDGGGKESLENLAILGKSIFVNAAPNEPYDGDLPFDVTLANYYSSGSGHVVANVSVDNTDLLAPYPVSTPYLTGNYFAHGVMRNYSTNFAKWISETIDPEEPVLVGGRAHNCGGVVALGAMTTTNWQQGDTAEDPSNLRVNILDYLCQDPVPCTIDAPIDIKFCSNPNGFNCKTKGGKSNKSSKGQKGEGVVPMTVFGTDTLNVNDIDISSVKLCLVDESECLDQSSLRSYEVKDRGSPTDVGASQCTMIKGTEQDYLTLDGIEDLELAWETQDVIERLLGNCCTLTNKAAGPTFIFKAKTTTTPPVDVISTPVNDPGVDQLFIQNGAGQCRLLLRD